MPFLGLPVLSEWLPDGLRMRIVRRYAFLDSNGRIWPVPAGTITDGTSIPRLLWTAVGSPFTGLYRDAGPPHDVAYNTLGVVKEEADLMLREAALVLGCPERLAYDLYEGVHHFGFGAYDAAQRRAAEALASR